MTFKREFEKAIKEYLAPLGFKKKPKSSFYIRNYSEDIIQSMGWADESCEEPAWHYLKTFVGVSSVSLKNILLEVTDGLAGGPADPTIGPPYFCMHKDWVSADPRADFIHCRFKPERPMEENIAEFDKMYEEEVVTLFDMYNTQKAIYLCPITDKYFEGGLYGWYYVPLAYYFNGEFDKAFEVIEERLTIRDGAEARILARYGSLSDESLRPRRIYENMRRNLKKWIEERRQFKVDDEYLPVF